MFSKSDSVERESLWGCFWRLGFGRGCVNRNTFGLWYTIIVCTIGMKIILGSIIDKDNRLFVPFWVHINQDPGRTIGMKTSWIKINFVPSIFFFFFFFAPLIEVSSGLLVSSQRVSLMMNVVKLECEIKVGQHLASNKSWTILVGWLNCKRVDYEIKIRMPLLATLQSTVLYYSPWITLLYRIFNIYYIV